ncbi:MAG TPA: cytochrome P450 [Thermoanaerobaculia bacterium]|nr:cytochrome P450 [Thermoanaerobaculia bacterium]
MQTGVTVPAQPASRNSQLPPGPRSFLPGAALRAMQRDPLGFLTRNAREYGDVSSWTFGPQRVFLFAHPDHVREVLVANDRSFMKGRALQRTKVILGEGLLTSEDPLHRRQRRLTQPSFHQQRVARYAEVMVEEGERTAERWRSFGELDVHHEMMRTTLAIVARTLFGAVVDEEADDIGAALSDLMEMFPLLLNPFSDLIRKLPLPRIRRFHRAIERLDSTIFRIIEERRATGEDRGDLLSMLLLARDEDDGGAMSDRQVRDEVMTLFLAGHETTANALTWTFHLLGQHPEVEGELHRELDAVVGDRAIEPADYPRLPFTKSVFAEAMRIFPPAWAIGRLALEDVRIGEVIVPQGAIAIVAPIVTHRDARWWPEPMRFEPARFAAADPARPKFAYFPFGGGSRVCIGESFAWSEGVLVLAALARRWRLTPAPGSRVEPRGLITLRPKGPVRMRLERRGSA